MKTKKNPISTVEANEEIRTGPTSTAIIQPKRDQNRGHWYCVTHDEDFKNQLQKDIHIHTGKHRMAWVCDEHGLEVP